MAKRFTYYGNSFDSDAQSFIDAALITGATQQSVLNTFVLMLKGTGTTNSSDLWSKIYALYPYCPIDGSTANATAYSYNLKNPATFQVAWTGFVSGDYTVNGVIGGSGKYGDTNLNILSNLPSMEFGIDSYTRTQNTSLQVEMGASKSVLPYDGGLIYPYGTVSVGYTYVNKFVTATLQTTRTGLLSAQYDGTNSDKYRNGVSFSTTAQTSAVRQNLNFIIHARNFGGVINANSTKSNAGFSIRQAFDTNEMADFFEAWDYYQTNIISGGRNV